MHFTQETFAVSAKSRNFALRNGVSPHDAAANLHTHCMETITSTHNARVKRALLLQQKSSERRRTGLFTVEGVRELQRCIESGLQVEEVFLCTQLQPASAAVVAPLLSAGPHPTPFVCTVSPAVYGRLAYRGTTEGVMAVVRQRSLSLADIPMHGIPAPSPLSPPCARTGSGAARHGAAPLFVVLESVEKPGNIGAVLRSADAAGATAVIVCDPLTDLCNPNLIRASTGAFFSVPTVACTTAECIAFLKGHGIAIVTAQLQDSSPYYATDMRRPVAIVMGTEADGLTRTWREAADEHIRIPMLGRCDSLNVSVSAAILLFEAVRQRLSHSKNFDSISTPSSSEMPLRRQ